jgi:hypothetical protein
MCAWFNIRKRVATCLLQPFACAGAISTHTSGTCYNVVGPGGAYIGINADICDGCTQYPGVGPSFNMYDNPSSKTQLFAQVLGPGAGGVGDKKAPTGITLQKVSCPLSIFNSDSIQIRWLLWYKVRALRLACVPDQAIEQRIAVAGIV